MKNFLKRIGFLASASILCASAHATTYNFVQNGYANGKASITGYFVGFDFDGDGFIGSKEIADFSATMTGDSYFDTFKWDYSWLNHNYPQTPQLGYKVGSGKIGDDPGEFIFVTSFYQIYFDSRKTSKQVYLYDEAYQYDSTSELITVTVVPEPGTWAMMLAGLAFIPAALKRGKRRNS